MVVIFQTVFSPSILLMTQKARPLSSYRPVASWRLQKKAPVGAKRKQLMIDSQVKPGLKVRTNERLYRDTGAFCVKPKYLDARRPNAIGEVHSFIPGHGGDVWWVVHGEDDVAAYCFDEFEPA